MTNSTKQTCYQAFLQVINNAGTISLTDMLKIGRDVFNLNASDCMDILDEVIESPLVKYKDSTFSIVI